MLFFVREVYARALLALSGLLSVQKLLFCLLVSQQQAKKAECSRRTTIFVFNLCLEDFVSRYLLEMS